MPCPRASIVALGEIEKGALHPSGCSISASLAAKSVLWPEDELAAETYARMIQVKTSTAVLADADRETHLAPLTGCARREDFPCLNQNSSWACP